MVRKNTTIITTYYKFYLNFVFFFSSLFCFENLSCVRIFCQILIWFIYANAEQQNGAEKIYC